MQEPFSEFSEELNLTGTVINEDEILDDYEPSEREINSYAIQLGMDPQEDQDYLYLAREGLKAPIPKPWTACRTKDGKIFYYNFETEESQWEHPLDQNYKEKFAQVKYNRTKGSMSPISIHIQTVENQTLEYQNNVNTERIEFTAESPVGSDMMDSLEFSDIQSKNKGNNDFQQVLSFDESRQSLHFVVEKAGNKIKQQVKQQGEKKSSSGGSSKEYIGSGENILDKALVMGQSDNEEEEEENSEKIFGEYFDTEGAWQRTDGDERTPGLNTLKEIEIEASEAFQKYEDDLKSQFSYVISQFEQNYQKHAAKIEEQYQKEIKKLEQEVEENNNFEDQIKTIETEVREQYEKDLKSQIKDLNKAYENMRESMEVKAEAEIQHCLEEVREKWNVEIQTISKNVVHRRAKSASIKPEVPEYQLDNRRSSWGYMDSVKANSSSNFNRLGQEVLFDFGKDCERFAREVQKSLKEEIKIIEVEKQEYRKSLVNTKSIMEKHYKQKFQENKRKLEEEFAQNQSDSSCSSNNYDNSLSCSIADNERFAALKARGPELLKQLNSLKQPNKQAKQERELKSELKQLEEDIFYRTEYVDFMNKIAQKTSLVNKDVQAKEKAIKVLEKEINEIEKEVATYKKQLKNQQSVLDELKQQEVEKDHLSLKAQNISSKIEKIDNEIETLKHTPIIPAPVVHHPKESQKDLSKILNGIKEIKDLAKHKSRGSAEKSRKSSSPNKHNRTIEYNPTTNYSQQIETNIDDDFIQDISVSPFLKDEHPKRSQAISYEWEEEEKSYDREGRSRTREFSRGLPPQLEKCPQTDFEWKVFLETEQSRISIYVIALQRKKYDLRKSQDELEKDQDEYKHDYLSYKHDKNKRTYTRRLQLENRKKCLNQRIKKYNEILFWIREQENILASKKDILKNIEKTFEEAYRCQGLDEDTLGYLHRVYKGINLDDYNLITENSTSPNKSLMRTQQDESMYLTSKSSNNNYASYAKLHHGMVKEKEKMLWSRGGNLKQLTLE